MIKALSDIPLLHPITFSADPMDDPTAGLLGERFEEVRAEIYIELKTGKGAKARKISTPKSPDFKMTLTASKRRRLTPSAPSVTSRSVLVLLIYSKGWWFRTRTNYRL